MVSKYFAVHTQNDKEKWENFVTEHELFDFINCLGSSESN